MRGDIYLSIWNTAADRVSVSVTSPTGEIIERFPVVDLARLESRAGTGKGYGDYRILFPHREFGAASLR